MVMDETTCMVRVACVISYFFRDESCGQCTQCREGTGWIHKICEKIERGRGSAEPTWRCSTSCRARWKARRSAPSPTPRPGRCRACCATSASDFEAHMREKKCPFPESFEL